MSGFTPNLSSACEWYGKAVRVMVDPDRLHEAASQLGLVKGFRLSDDDDLNQEIEEIENAMERLEELSEGEREELTEKLCNVESAISYLSHRRPKE